MFIFLWNQVIRMQSSGMIPLLLCELKVWIGKKSLGRPILQISYANPSIQRGPKNVCSRHSIIMLHALVLPCTQYNVSEFKYRYILGKVRIQNCIFSFIANQMLNNHYTTLHYKSTVIILLG
jgi:hypothetical protein